MNEGGVGRGIVREEGEVKERLWLGERLGVEVGKWWKSGEL
ncbi:hypothetical protein [Bacillus thuringiensis]|nr:hypothetical protein [Bacillus thuringiensis]